MKKTILSLGALALSICGFSQTQLFFEDFEGTPAFNLNTAELGGQVGSAGDNEWIINNVYAGGAGTTTICLPGTAFTIGNVDDQSTTSITSPGGNYMHILSDEAAAAGINNANYSPADGLVCFQAQSHFASMSSNISTTGYTGVTLDFWWLGVGSASAVMELYYSLDGGVTWTQQGGSYSSQATWTQESITNAAWDGQTQLRFGFRFDNGVVLAGSDPAYSIDDIEVTGTSSGCSDSFSSFSTTACNSYTVPSGDETYTTAGVSTVMDTIPNVAGCDSIMTIMVTINTVDASATDNLDGTATANSSTGTYQWLDCDNSYSVIAGETNATYSPASTGNYAVEVTDNGCVDTSACINIMVGGFDDLNTTLEIYPNPSDGTFSVNFGNYTHEINMTVTDMSGQIIFVKNNFIPNSTETMELDVAPGVYVMSIKEIGTAQIRQARITIE